MASIFNSKRGVRGLFILVFGIIILSIIGMFIFQYYERSNRRNISFGEARRAIISWTVMANHTRNRQLKKVIAAENHSWLRVTIENSPLPKVQVIQSSDIWLLQQHLATQRDSIHLSLQLPRHGYLNIIGHKPNYWWKNAAILFCVFFLLCLLILLCYWVIQYISTALEPLTKAVERFGYDLKAPAIQEQGSPEMSHVIRSFNAMQENIRSLVEGRTQMLAAISHDLRTPITRLKLRAENIADEKTQAKVLADLNDMEYMIASILAFAREQSSDEAEQSFDLNLLVESVCHDFEDMHKPVTYTSNTARFTYVGRMLSLKRAVTNIIENALKYGKVCQVNMVVAPDRICIEFHDQGPGIPNDKMEKVFQPFYRVDNARTPTVPGSGLGLAVSAEIIKSHGGDIQLKNLAEGLQVKLILPSRPV